MTVSWDSNTAKKSKVLEPRKRRKQTGVKSVKPLVVFFVEGQSEKSYIKALREFRYDNKVAFEFPNERGTSLKNLVDACRRAAKAGKLRGSSGTWIVCDVDRNEDHFDDCDKWQRKDKEKNRIALSNPCLEYWLLLHFTSSPKCSSANAALGELKRHWPEYKKGLEPSKGFEEKIVEKTDDAVERETTRQSSMRRDPSAWPDGPGSQMPALIAWLDELLEGTRKG